MREVTWSIKRIIDSSYTADVHSYPYHHSCDDGRQSGCTAVYKEATMRFIANFATLNLHTRIHRTLRHRLTAPGQDRKVALWWIERWCQGVRRVAEVWLRAYFGVHKMCIIKGRLCNIKRKMCKIKCVHWESNKEQMNECLSIASAIGAKYLFTSGDR